MTVKQSFLKDIAAEEAKQLLSIQYFVIAKIY
jgi:hypothetical protein